MDFLDVRETARRYAGVSASDDSQDDLLEAGFDAAVRWFQNAGVEPRDDDPLYTAMVLMLMVWYRTSAGLPGPDQEIPRYIVSSVHQLREAGV